MGRPFFTIILPIHRGPAYLPLSVASVLDQTCPDFELFIVEDGAPPETHDLAVSMAEGDERIRVFRYPKGRRHGEEHRATAMKEAQGEIVTHINDDSLWMPDHLAAIRDLSGPMEFGHTLLTRVDQKGRIGSLTSYLEDRDTRERMLAKLFNVMNMCNTFYRREAYESLTEKWHPAPEDTWTDLYMWRKFLELPLRFGTIHRCTTLFFDYPVNYSDDDSVRQIDQWRHRTRTIVGRARVRWKVRRIHQKARKRHLRR